ncbi:MAG: hypothetical protein IT371_14725 [Deltaproteobacteria bacterium]|nr:hypothetical protein [Deltaproteobacteria bacterium]
MRTSCLASITFAIALGGAACSGSGSSTPDTGSTATADSGGTPAGDASSPTRDGGTPADQGQPSSDSAAPRSDGAAPRADGSKPTGDGGKALSCAEIGTCSDTCAQGCSGLGKLACLIKCSDDCKKKGCAAAQSVYGTLYGCVSTKCFLDCSGGPTPACKTCVQSKCVGENTACNGQKC